MIGRVLLEILILSCVGYAIMYLVRKYSSKGRTSSFYKWLWKEKFIKQDEYEEVLSPEQRRKIYKEYTEQ